MKNVKSLKFGNEELVGLSYVEKIVLGLWELKVRWMNDYGVSKFLIEYEESDVWMMIEDWMCVRYEASEGMYYVELVRGGVSWEIGKFDIESIGGIYEGIMMGEWRDMEDIYAEMVNLNDVHLGDLIRNLERKVFVDRELGEYEKNIREYKWDSLMVRDEEEKDEGEEWEKEYGDDVGVDLDELMEGVVDI